MTPTLALGLVLTETEKTFRRGPAIAGLVLSVLFALGVAGIVWAVNVNVVEVAGQAAIDASGGSVTNDDIQRVRLDSVLQGTLGLRGLLFFPVLAFLVGAATFAAEYHRKTLREDLLRPVPRWAILGAKWAALVVWVTAALLLSSLTAVVAGLPFGADGIEWGLLGTLVFTTWLTDLGFTTLAFAVAIVTRSVPGTLATMVMFFVLQLGLAAGFGILTAEGVEQMAASYGPSLVPGSEALIESAFEWVRELSKWQPPLVVGTCTPADLPWQAYTSIAVVTVLSLVVGLWRFERMDVP